MIIYKKAPIEIQMKNIMLLDDDITGGVVYVDKATYDQAILLFSRFDGDIRRILKSVESNKTSGYESIAGFKETLEVMMNTMPEPLNAIAPFLLYCANNKGIEWDKNDREFAYGALHQLSQLLDFNAITLVPAEVRNMITISTVILKQYKNAWNDLTMMLDEKVVRIPTAAWEQFQTNIVGLEKKVGELEEKVREGSLTQTVTPQYQQPIQSVQQKQSTQPFVQPAQTLKKEESEEDIMAKILAKAQADADSKNAARREQENKNSNNTGSVKNIQSSNITQTPVKRDSLLEDKVEVERREMNAVLDEFDV